MSLTYFGNECGGTTVGKKVISDSSQITHMPMYRLLDPGIIGSYRDVY